MAKSKKRISRSFRDNTDNNLFDVSDMNDVRTERIRTEKLHSAHVAERTSSSLSGHNKIVAHGVPVEEFISPQATSDEEVVGWDDRLQKH